MISKPTTEQVLNDCSRELMQVVLPALTDETVKVTVLMLDLVLRNAAVRAAHEIAWMTQEIEELEAFAGSNAPGHSETSQPDGLHLDDVVDRYRAASEAFSDAMDTAVSVRDHRLISEGVALMERRVGREEQVMCGWTPVGR